MLIHILWFYHSPFTSTRRRSGGIYDTMENRTHTHEPQSTTRKAAPDHILYQYCIVAYAILYLRLPFNKITKKSIHILEKIQFLYSFHRTIWHVFCKAFRYWPKYRVKFFIHEYRCDLYPYSKNTMLRFKANWLIILTLLSIARYFASWM